MIRAILDEGVPKGLARRLREAGIDATPFPNGWKQLSNGNLLNEIERQGYDVLVTNDKQMQFQQNIAPRRLAVVVLPSNARVIVYGLLPAIAAAISRVTPGEFYRIDASGEVSQVRPSD